MIEKNHCQHIGIITGYDRGVTVKQRLAGYQEALSSHDMLLKKSIFYRHLVIILIQGI